MPVAGRTRKDVVTEFREAEILQAAWQVFARRGFADAAMEEIAQAAGLAKGTLYLYYPSKRDLYRAALRAGLTEMCDTLARSLEAPASLPERIAAYVSTKVRHFDEHRDFFRIYLGEFGQAACGAVDPDFRDLGLRQIKLLEDAIRAGVKAGEADVAATATEAAAYAIADLTRGVILRRLMGWSKTPTGEKEVSFVVDFARKALGCR
jgi:AcrR family transcriptional regulator